MPHGVLFRGSGDGRIREAMLKADLFEAIIGLPENLFAGTGIPATVLILNKAKAPERKGKVLFIHGAKKFEERPKKNILGEGDIKEIRDAFRAWKDEDRFCRVVEMKEIAANDFNLNISRYIDTLEPERPIDVKAELGKLWAAEKARDEAAARMNALLKEMGYVG
jgi:type I restriction enzyme M protein